MSTPGSDSTVLDKVKVAITDRTHPIWRLLNMAVILVFVLLYSKANATKFDETEIIFLLELATTLAGYEGLKALFTRKKEDAVG